MNVGASLTGFTVIVNVSGADVSTPRLVVPPSSFKRTVTVAVPLAFGAGVKLRSPLRLIAGTDENSEGLLFDTRKVTACDDSFAGPGTIFFAHAATSAGPLSSRTA